MIAILVAPAVLQTPRVSAQDETLDVMGTPLVDHRAPDARPLGGQGLGVAWLRDGEDDHWFVEAGLRVDAPRYELPGFTFAPLTTSIRLDAGGLSWFDHGGPETPAIDGYGLFAAGLQVSILGAEPFTTAVAPAVHTAASLGVGARGGRVRPRLELRTDFALRVDHLAGRAERPTSAFTWTWWPGEAALSLVVGATFAGA